MDDEETKEHTNKFISDLTWIRSELRIVTVHHHMLVTTPIGIDIDEYLHLPKPKEAVSDTTVMSGFGKITLFDTANDSLSISIKTKTWDFKFQHPMTAGKYFSCQMI